jgi:hypothetical protein
LGKIYTELDDRLTAFVAAQRMFFVSTAPLAADGHINLSPKGLDSFRILNPREVAYLDLTGSGVETIAHLRENGRMTIMFCAFEGAPRILRLYGRGRTIEPGDGQWSRYRGNFPEYPGVRSVIVMDLERVADSCGYAVPRFAFQEQRMQLTEFAERKGEEALACYRREHNSQSIDGLPGLRQFS